MLGQTQKLISRNTDWRNSSFDLLQHLIQTSLTRSEIVPHVYKDLKERKLRIPISSNNGVTGEGGALSSMAGHTAQHYPEQCYISTGWRWISRLPVSYKPFKNDTVVSRIRVCRPHPHPGLRRCLDSLCHCTWWTQNLENRTTECAGEHLKWRPSKGDLLRIGVPACRSSFTLNGLTKGIII